MEISQNNKKLYTNVGIALAAYFVVVRPILQKFGIIKTKEELEKIKTEAENIQEFENKINASGIQLSKSKTEWDQIADTIYNDLRYSLLDDNKEDAAYQIARVQNDADIIYLLKTFGKRQEYFFGLPVGSPKGLFEFINTNLSRENINLVNNNYKRKGLKYKF